MSVAIDNELIYMNNVATAATVNGSVIDLGHTGMTNTPMLVTVRLTTGVTSGSVASVKIQSAADAAFSSPVDEMTVTVPAAVGQTVPCTLVQFFMPLELQNRYTRVVVTGGSTAPSGGKLWAYLTPDVMLPV